MGGIESERTASSAEATSSELVITGGETADHTVPADVFLRTLDHLQRIVYLLAASEEMKPIRERVALSESFRKRYGLRFGVPKESSFAVPLSLGLSPMLNGLEHGPSPLDRTLNVLRSAAQGAWSDVAQAVPDLKYLPRIMNELQAMLPRPGDRWGIALRVGTERVELDSKTYRAIRDYLSPDGLEDTVMTVTGDLVRVDIAGRRVVIRYRPTGREIPCFCEESALESVLENWSEPIQVTGRFTLDRTGHPTKLSGVTRVEPIDLSPMTFDRIEWLGRQLVFDPPLTLEPTMDEESGQLYILIDEKLGIDVYAQTRENVIDELAEQLLFQWDTYAIENPERLTPGARRLREALRSRMREDTLATP
jgi:hypothetical protein